MSLVVLVNEHDEQTGVLDKMQAHQQGLLHRAFSVFIFNSNGEMLLQQRAAQKYHSANLWTNACCSHPLPGEEIQIAARRRMQEELGIDCDLKKIFSFTYRTAFENGLIEHEYDHVFTGICDLVPSPDPAEVQAISYLDPTTLSSQIQCNPETFTSWFLLALPKLRECQMSR